MKVYLCANRDSYMNLLLIHMCFLLGLQLEWSSVGQSDVNNCACFIVCYI